MYKFYIIQTENSIGNDPRFQITDKRFAIEDEDFDEKDEESEEEEDGLLVVNMHF